MINGSMYQEDIILNMYPSAKIYEANADKTVKRNLKIRYSSLGFQHLSIIDM